MEHLDYEKIALCNNQKEEVKRQLSYLVETGIITEEEKQCIFIRR